MVRIVEVPMESLGVSFDVLDLVEDYVDGGYSDLPEDMEDLIKKRPERLVKVTFPRDGYSCYYYICTKKEFMAALAKAKKEDASF